MIDRPIIFSAPLIRALLAGTKTQTRRLLRCAVPAAPAMDAVHPNHTPRHATPYLDAYCDQPKTAANPRGMGPNWAWWTRDDRPGATFRVGYAPGDRLWVREAWKPVPISAYRCSEGVQQTPDPSDADQAAVYRAGWDRSTGGTPWRPSIHMPRWASRLTLTVTDVRVQRLQDITEADAIAEGVHAAPENQAAKALAGIMAPGAVHLPHKSAFASLWDHLHGPSGWERNPEVVALTFTVAHRNIDA